MALVIKNLYSGYFTYIQDKRDTRLDGYLFLGTPWTVITVLTVYWLFVKKIGPKLMKNIESFELKTILKLYNIGQVIINAWLTLTVAHYVYLLAKNAGKIPWCIETDYSDTEIGIYGAKLSYIYFLIKLFDLFDTIFFVLRKRYNQITFLHVYHHIVIAFGSWISVQYTPAGQSTLLGLFNSFVHVIMYGYYYVTSQYSELKSSLWWKKYITQLQLTQFASLVVVYAIPLVSRECSYSKSLAIFGLVQNVVMLVLFSNFYRKAYLKKLNKIS